MLLSRTTNLSAVIAAACLGLTALTGCTSNSQRSEAVTETTESHHANAAHDTGMDSGKEDGMLQAILPDSPVTTRPAPAGMTRATMAFPTGRANTSAVLVEKTIPSTINVGEEFEYTIMVKNISALTLDNVELTDSFSDDFDMVSASPRAGSASRGANSVWDLGSIEPGQARTITVRGTAESAGRISACGNVTYDSSVCIAANVVEPALKLAKTATARTSQCGVIVYTYTVTNSGTGNATNVRIIDTLPRGINAQDGGSRVEIPVGTLAAGQSRSFQVNAGASRTGTFSSMATATGGSDLEAESGKPETVVVKPELSIAIDCPEQQYIQRNATYRIDVENEGDGDAANTRVVATIPAGTTFVSATDGGQRNGNQVVWNAGTLKAGANKSMSVTLASTTAGSKTVSANANAECATAVNDSCSTNYRGIPAILLEVVDIVDPVEVGQQTTYVITATNQGSAPDTNVKIVCELPESMTFVSGTGATTVSNRGNAVTMAAVTTLGVGQQATWRVTIRANDEDNARFAVTMTSDQLGNRPVEETEATNLYR